MDGLVRLALIQIGRFLAPMPLGLGLSLAILLPASAQDTPRPPSPVLPASERTTPVNAGPGSLTPTNVAAQPVNDELLDEIRRLRSEVGQIDVLRQQVQALEGELSVLRQTRPVSAGTATYSPMTTRGGSPARRLTTTHSGSSTFTEVYGDAEHPTRDNLPLDVSYRYNLGTGALGGGGYVHLGDEDGEFSVNLTNQITIDGTFYDQRNMPTIEKGFNVPFARTFLYGNLTKNWLYQIGTQGFLGQFNLLDMWGAYRFGDALTLRFGKGLTPPLLEYYGFSPAMEPVITNSPLFQLAGKRQLGVMATGNLLGGRLQYWSGVNNPGTSFWYSLNNNVEYTGEVTLTPFANTDGIFKALGGGAGFSSGYDQYSLNPGTRSPSSTAPVNPPQTPNSSPPPASPSSPTTRASAPTAYAPASPPTSSGTGASASWPNT